MRIIFTKHALGKFKHPSIIKLGIKRKHIKSALVDPDYSAEIPERRVMFILKKIDADHDLRVIYRGNGAIIVIVTFYPSTRGRYEKTQN